MTDCLKKKRMERHVGKLLAGKGSHTEMDCLLPLLKNKNMLKLRGKTLKSQCIGNISSVSGA